MQSEIEDDYIPYYPKKQLAKLISRLPAASICDLCMLWGHEKQARVRHKFSLYKQRHTNKQKLVSRILLEYWTEGLNLLQLAQLDVQCIIDKPRSYSWVSSTAYSGDFPTVIKLDPTKFIVNLQQDLKNLFYTHIYICQHPNLPLILLRIQLFDVSQGESEKLFVNRKPFFVAIPNSSPHIIHSIDEDVSSQLIMQGIERTISSTDRVVKLKPDDQHPVKSLETMNLALGNSRYAQCLGTWSTYARNKADIPILEDAGKHNALQEQKTLTKEHKSTLRFKGFVTEEPCDDKYSSLAPVQQIEFHLPEANIKLKLHGDDVFGGLHELCDQGKVDLGLLPGWLTGEEGTSSGVIRDGHFRKLSTRTGGLI